MELDQARRIQDESLKRRWKLRESKGHDYATNDILSNFKRMSSILSKWKIDITRPEGVALFYALLKIDRLCNLIFTNKTPMNESLQDTIDDLKNYIDLMEECILEDLDE